MPDSLNRSKIPGPPSVVLEDVSLCYQRRAVFFLSRQKNLRAGMDFWALRNITMTLHEGETVGLIGRNGSGKSTISMIICGSLPPDRGRITVHGRVHLLALGIGFRPTLTGRENVIIGGTILGMSRREVKEKMEDIADFADLGDFFDEPVEIYSAGMRSRLGFAIATAVNPDILILDEVMSTGDASFRQKAQDRLTAMRKKTKTVIVVSHSPGQLQELCSRVIWLEKGRMLMDGGIEEVLPLYEEFCEKPVRWLDAHPEFKILLHEKS
jgi:ABC-type polysaccharide/polyol phosphate transport system ATPase subunit